MESFIFFKMTLPNVHNSGWTAVDLSRPYGVLDESAQGPQVLQRQQPCRFSEVHQQSKLHGNYLKAESQEKSV